MRSHHICHVLVPLLVFLKLLLDQFKSERGDLIFTGEPRPINFGHTIKKLGCYNVPVVDTYYFLEGEAWIDYSLGLDMTTRRAAARRMEEEIAQDEGVPPQGPQKSLSPYW
uniref:Uncharacterized protein n=1 Tax=Solanum tuberosum TaxID=4113 RepID=M1DKG5_SOLTU